VRSAGDPLARERRTRVLIRWALGLSLLLDLRSLVEGGLANFPLLEPTPSWVSHRWEPVFIATGLSLLLIVGAAVFAGLRPNRPAPVIAALLLATVAVAVGGIEWQARSFPEPYFTHGFGSLQLGPTATRGQETYLADPDAINTLAPSATQKWTIHAPLAQGCAPAERAALRWADVATPIDYESDRRRGSALDCHFEVRRGQFDVTFQHVSGGREGPWVLEAFMNLDED
jgi:hypothetical protein